MENFDILKNINDSDNERVQNTLEQDEFLKVSKIEDHLKSIDKKILKDIFLEIFKSAGRKEVLGRYLGDSNVTVEYNESKKIRGSFYPGSDNTKNPRISLNAASFAESSDDMTKASVLYVYVHEQVHALSTDRAFHKDYFDNLDKRYIGFERQEKKLGESKISVSYRELNEGMTQVIAEQVADEYLRRTGVMSGQDREDHHIDYVQNVYLDYKILVDNLIFKLSEEYSLPEDVIKNSLIQAYFAKKDINSNFSDWLEQNHKILSDSV